MAKEKQGFLKWITKNHFVGITVLRYPTYPNKTYCRVMALLMELGFFYSATICCTFVGCLFFFLYLFSVLLMVDKYVIYVALDNMVRVSFKWFYNMVAGLYI